MICSENFSNAALNQTLPSMRLMTALTSLMSTLPSPVTSPSGVGDDLPSIMLMTALTSEMSTWPSPLRSPKTASASSTILLNEFHAGVAR